MNSRWKRLWMPVLWCLAIACIIEILLGMTDLFGEDIILWDTMFRAIGTVPVLLHFYREDEEMRGKSRFDLRTAAALFASGALLSVAFRILFTFIGVPGYEEETRALFTGNRVLQVLALLAASPLFEEFFFRGVLYTRLKDLVSVRSAMVISAVSFGLYHGNLSQGVYAFFMGIFLAWSMEHCKTVAAPLFIHIAANIAALLI